ncbi:hypothetical protein MLD38_036639 [Melastoma candidum]|uniref:Uncharacterized protein n=1 Tax=Melastoma candidum TaxID=119954 RepID=A0ACB9LKC8_9MYRT|nr:hypothetical protein MLD38_036639 [Melastoma candidum]
MEEIEDLCPRTPLRSMARKGRNTARNKGTKKRGLEKGESWRNPGGVSDATSQAPEVEELEEHVFWQNPLPQQVEVENPQRDKMYEDLLRRCVEHLFSEEDLDESDSDDSLDYLDIEVTDDNTTCTLYADGTYIAHKEGGLLKGVVDRIGERVMLEWRHTTESVWVRRVNRWTCFPIAENRSGEPVPCRDLVVSVPPLRKRVRDWFVREVRAKKRKRRLDRMVRRVVPVMERGVQTELEPDLMQGIQTGSSANPMENIPGGRVENGSTQDDEGGTSWSCEAVTINLNLMDEAPMDWGPGAWLIAGKLDGATAEVKGIIAELNLTARNNVNRERFASFERGIGNMEKWDRFNDEAMARFRTMISRDALLNRLNERINVLLVRSELSGDQDDEVETVVADHTDLEPAPLSFQEALELITSAIIDSRRPRPPALTSTMVRKTMAKLDQMELELTPLQRLKECRELRQMLNGLDGVPAHIGDLHEELYTLALMEVPDGNWLPDPVVPAPTSSGTSSVDTDLWLDERDAYSPPSPTEDPSWSDS